MFLFLASVITFSRNLPLRRKALMIRHIGSSRFCIQFRNAYEHWRRKDFLQWEPTLDFPGGGGQRDFSWEGPKVVKLHSLETKKTTFFVKNEIGKCQFLKSRGTRPPYLPTPMHTYWKRISFPVTNIHIGTGNKRFGRAKNFYLTFSSIFYFSHWKWPNDWEKHRPLTFAPLSSKFH